MRAARAKKKAATKPLADPSNALGRAYAISLRERAKALRTPLLLTPQVREATAQDLEALAILAESHPHVFQLLTPKAKTQ